MIDTKWHFIPGAALGAKSATSKANTRVAVHGVKDGTAAGRISIHHQQQQQQQQQL